MWPKQDVSFALPRAALLMLLLRPWAKKESTHAPSHSPIAVESAHLRAAPFLPPEHTSIYLWPLSTQSSIRINRPELEYIFGPVGRCTCNKQSKLAGMMQPQPLAALLLGGSQSYLTLKRRAENPRVDVARVVAFGSSSGWPSPLTLREAVNSVFPLNASKELFLLRIFCPCDLHLHDIFLHSYLHFSPRHLLVRSSPSASLLEL